MIILQTKFMVTLINQVFGLYYSLLIGYIFILLIKCGHCKHLKPEFEILSTELTSYGVKLGHVTDKQNDLINQFVVDHKTHMVSYPKMKVFLGE